jgi:putative nucleotidyltransferase with HDIG domain
MAAIEALAQAVDTKDQVTHEHVRRVQLLSIQLARALGINDRPVLEAIKAAALLHDVGKIGIPEHILNKPGRLTASEFEVMKQHAPMGAEILSLIDFPYPVVPIVRHHHENWDGTGYPDKISGEAIPIGARILQVVDCYDALTSDRPYRRRLAPGDALQILADRKNTMYDPRIVDAFFALLGTDVASGAASGEGAENPEATPRTLDAAPSGSRGEPALRSFYDLGREIPASPSAQDVGEAIWRHVGPQLPAAAFVLHIYDADRNALVIAFSSHGELTTPDTRPMGEGLTGWVGSTARAAVNSDARLDLPDVVTARLELNTTLAVPALAGEQVVAVLTFYSRELGAFTDAHCRFAEAAAEIVAGACTRSASAPAAHAA